MLRPAIVFALLVALSAALAGCAREETRMPDTVPPLPSRSGSLGSAAPQPPPPPPPPPMAKK